MTFPIAPTQSTRADMASDREDLTLICPHCFDDVRLPGVPVGDPKIRGRCRKCNGQFILVANKILYRRRVETPWLKRKLLNAERFARIADSRDIVYSELFVAFEVLVRMLHECIGYREDKGLRKMVDSLRDENVVTRSQHRMMQDAITDRNRLFHGESVRLEALPIDHLQEIIKDLRWYFIPAPEVNS